VGASLLAETWPSRWRPWLAAVLQTAVNLGVVLAGLAVYLMSSLSPRWVFLVGILPALVVLWIRYAVPEPEEWHQARQQTGAEVPRFRDLFGPGIRRISILSLVVCSLTLTAHWAFLFWSLQQIRNLPEVADWTDASRNELVGQMMMAGCVTSILGNYLAGGLASKLGYRHAIALMSLGYFTMMFAAYCVPRSLGEMWFWFVAISSFHGIFALFTMYLPPLFPTLLRTTGAGFCYNFGRIVAALGTVFFGTFSSVGDFRLALLYASFLFLPAAAAAWLLPEPPSDP
jgi:MFS family permease